uniref:Uncharacterized protein n=2 Tax=Oryza TaxID=4527 RepID=Q69MQ2_ORYSJ|nr:hypothetical protein [Oryza sativa Japonica Group]
MPPPAAVAAGSPSPFLLDLVKGIGGPRHVAASPPVGSSEGEGTIATFSSAGSGGGEDIAVLPPDHRLPSHRIWWRGGPCHAAAMVDGGGGGGGGEEKEEVERKREGIRREEEVDCGWETEFEGKSGRKR